MMTTYQEKKRKAHGEGLGASDELVPSAGAGGTIDSVNSTRAYDNRRSFFLSLAMVVHAELRGRDVVSYKVEHQVQRYTALGSGGSSGAAGDDINADTADADTKDIAAVDLREFLARAELHPSPPELEPFLASQGAQTARDLRGKYTTATHVCTVR
jgi:hypothetical protein